MALQKTSNRLLALDILRGITIAGMLLVNNPGSWSSIYTPLEHAPWNGLTPTDLVFPFFMFIMGISTYFSLRKFDFKPSKHLLVKIVRRTVTIFCIGILIHMFSHVCYSLAHADAALPLSQKLSEAFDMWHDMRILGVMQRLAICYGVSALIAIYCKYRTIIYIVVSLLVIYAIALILGNGYALDQTNIIYIVDSAVLGESHMYHGLEVLEGATNTAFDPEGLFSTLPSIAHVLIGLLCGRILTRTKDNWQRISDLFIVGGILTFVGFLLSYGLPINKNIWSPTFVLTTCGMASTLLGLLIWIIDIRGNRKWCLFFETFGINPLFLYVLGGVLGILMNTVPICIGEECASLHKIIYNLFLLSIFSENTQLASCLYAIIFICINWCFGYILYKKKIYIKI